MTIPEGSAKFQVMMDLSTAHMPSSNPDWGDLTVVRTPYGFIVFVRVHWEAEGGEGIPEWIRPVMEDAEKHDVLLINFDPAGEWDPDLPTWEW